ncbi:hypothetical protein MVEN_01119800 [Mycena venus]|uniref:Glycoside hydrolase family 5 protein n=1 Tax=Mycena venus TaxID=2733690 RepID=A0A8H6Y8E3_9AGAR|nr:hypothetical protein MVEN_01119800 [Mycena venus]
MKLTPFFTALLPSVLAANSFAGGQRARWWHGTQNHCLTLYLHNYYIYALATADRIAILNGMQAAGIKVLRTWVTVVGAGQKASNNIAGMHDKNALQGGDIYDRPSASMVSTSTRVTAINAFNQRITHILNIHKNTLLGNQPWKHPTFSFTPRPMIFDQIFYLIRNNTGDRNQLIFTGGGSATASVQPTFFGSSCPAIDVVAIHDYNDDYDSFMPSAIIQAKAAGKKLIIEEWGSLVGSGRTANLNSNVQKVNNYKVP